MPAPYAAIIAESPEKAIDTAWHDAEQAAIGALETKMTFAERTQPIAIGALVLMLRQFASVDQAHAEEFGRLAAGQKAIVGGTAATESLAREFCAKAAELIAYFGAK